MKRFLCPVALLCLSAAAAPVHATVVFTENFDTDHSANWTFTSSITGDAANDGIGGDADAFFDYSALVPPAPGGGTTRGMKVTANLPGTGIFSGVTMTLNNQTFDFANKAYKITAKVWLNYYGGTASGTTEEVFMGVGANPGTSQFVADPSFNSVQFATSTDGDTSTDWRAYKTPWPIQGPTDPAPGTPAVGRVQQGVSGVYAADPSGNDTGNATLNSSHPYYLSHFPGGEVPPDLQKNAFTNQQPNSVGMPATPGTVAFAWHTWTITTSPNGGPIRYYVSDAAGNDILIATIQGGTTNPYTLGGNSIYFGMNDINASSPPTGFDADKLLFGLFDNIIVADITGDANLDGKINADDFALIDRGFAKHLTGWQNGDFNGDGVIDAADYLLIDTAFLQQSGSDPSFLLALRTTQFGDAYAASLLAAVPEPASLAACAFALLPLIRRRTR